MVRVSREGPTEVFKEYGRSLFLTFFTVLSRVHIAIMIVYLPLSFLLGDRFWLLAFINNYRIYLFLPLVLIIPFGLVMRRIWIIIPSVILAIIGIILVAPYFIPKSLAPAAGPMLSVVTFDVSAANTDLSAIKDWLLQTNADVILLQEVNTFQIRKGQLSGSSKRFPFQHGVFFSDVPWGNFILSRYPIRKIDKLDIERGASIAMQQRYEIDVNGQIVAVYNTNFAYPLIPGGLPRFRIPLAIPVVQAALLYDPGMRDSQIRAFLNIFQYETRPFVVAGNFNMSDQTRLYGEVARTMRDSFREGALGLGATWPLTPGNSLMARLTSPLFRVDYIWHSDSLRTVSADRGPRGLGSDHLPVYATFELGNP